MQGGTWWQLVVCSVVCSISCLIVCLVENNRKYRTLVRSKHGVSCSSFDVKLSRFHMYSDQHLKQFSMLSAITELEVSLVMKEYVCTRAGIIHLGMSAIPAM